MHGKLKKNKIKRRRSFGEIVLLVLVFVFTYTLVGALRHRGIPDKWGTATLATLIPFCFVIYANRQRLSRWSFWVSLSSCFAVHAIGMWIAFRYVLANWERFSTLLWYPFMLVEAFVLLIAVKRIAERLTGQHETIRVRL
jgi:hypothetical protein